MRCRRVAPAAALRDAGVQQFPDLRIGAEHGRLHLLQVLDRRVGVLQIVADHARIEREVQAQHALHHVAHRQQRQAFVAGAQRQQRARIGDQVQRIAVRQRAALAGMPVRGNSSTAGWSAAIGRDRRPSRPSPAARDERWQALAHRIGEIAQALHVEDDDALQRRTAVAHQQRPCRAVPRSRRTARGSRDWRRASPSGSASSAGWMPPLTPPAPRMPRST